MPKRVIKKIQSSLRNRSGFTLIELLVTIGVLSFILFSASTYTHSGERQIILFKEQANLIQALQRAKSMGLNAYGEESAACGYGVHFAKPRTFLIFKDLAADCAAADQKFTGDISASCGDAIKNPECVTKFVLNSKTSFSEDTIITDIIFIPPDPTVKIFPDATEAVLKINITGSNFQKSVKVNNAGQITAI